jgi:hypothetical protein
MFFKRTLTDPDAVARTGLSIFTQMHSKKVNRKGWEILMSDFIPTYLLYPFSFHLIIFTPWQNSLYQIKSQFCSDHSFRQKGFIFCLIAVSDAGETNQF